MRLMIVSIIAFSLAALAMLVADGRFTRALGIASLWGGDAKQVHFSVKYWQPKQSSRLISIPVQQGRTKTMVGFPSYATLKFPLPKYTNVTAGRVILEFSLQIPDSGGGSFRIFINNEKRADLLFDPDEEKYRVIIELSKSDIKEEILTISLSADGYGAGGECPDDRARIAIIEIETNSRLELNLENPIYHPADAMLLAGNPVRILALENETQHTREQLLILLQKLKMHGILSKLVKRKDSKGQIAIRLDPTAREPRFDPRKLEIVISGHKDFGLFLQNYLHEAHNVQIWDKNQKQVDLKSLGLSASARQFKHNIKWRTEYSLKNMPNGEMPQKLNLDIYTSVASDISDGLITITQNDDLIYSRQITANKTNKGGQFSIPLNSSALRNSLEIHLYTNESKIGICNPGREGFAQISKTSHLATFKSIPTNLSESLPSQLLDAGSLQFHVPFALEQSSYVKIFKLLDPITPSSINFITSKKKSTGVIATIIPPESLKLEIPKYLSWISDGNHSGKPGIPHAKIWISLNQINSEGIYKNSNFAPLTRSLANHIIAHQRNEPIIILQFPEVKKEQTNG